MSNELSELDELSAEAVRAVIANGQWQNVPELALQVSRVGIDAIRLQDETAKQQKAEKVEADEHIDADGWDGDASLIWRLVLDGNKCQCCVYFRTEPDYARIKAFAAAAGMPAPYAKLERRADG